MIFNINPLATFLLEPEFEFKSRNTPLGRVHILRFQVSGTLKSLVLMTHGAPELTAGRGEGDVGLEMFSF